MSSMRVILVISLIFIILYYIVGGIFLSRKFNIMKVIKLILRVIWTISLQNICLWLIAGWHWLWSKTTIDEKAIGVVKETVRRTKNAADEMEDVVDALKGKKFNQNGASKKTKHKKGN